MSYKYTYEGSNGGYPLEEDPGFDRWFDAVRSTHTCCICQEEGHEDNFYKTSMGWMHVDCYNEVVLNAAEDGSQIPELL